MSQLTVAEALRAASRVLAEGGVESAARDARLLMAHVLQVEAARMTLHVQDVLSVEDNAEFKGLIAERAKRRPLAQLTGQRQFYGRAFEVSGDVLDPRGDTETLVAAALEAPFERVLDLGTGSGCIVLSLLAERDGTFGLATDLSPAALAVAKRNAAKLGLEGRVRFQLSSWFEAVEGVFDLIVSNPPYIALDEMAGLQAELGYEPRMALTDEADGLTAYREIVANAAGFLSEGGRLMVEIGASQAADVAALLGAYGFEGVQVVQDLEGRERVVWGQKPPETV